MLKTTGQKLKEAGCELALSNAPESWRDAFTAAIKATDGPFTSDDIRTAVEQSYDGPMPSEKAWGGAMSGARMSKLIERVKGEEIASKRPISHGRELKVWRLKAGAA